MLALLGVASVAVAVVLGNRDESDDARVAAREILLEPAGEPGPSPFTEPVDPPATTTEPPPTSEPSTTTAEPSPPEPVVVTAPTSGVAPPPGSPPYGGSGDDTVCDREKLIAFLTGDRAKGEAWAGVRGISYADLETYVRALTPTVLLYDTRVTNHGFAGGRATPRQSVLQAGTAVLVDTNGDPVARCKCGNPLRPPTPVEQPVYTGAPWPAFDPRVQVTVVNGGTVTVIVQAPGPTSPAATEPPTDVTVPDESTSPDSTLPSDELTPEPTPEEWAELLVGDALLACGLDATFLDTQADPDLPGTYTVRVLVAGEEAIFVVDVDTGAIGEGDRVSAGIVEQCGIGGVPDGAGVPDDGGEP